MIQKIKCYFGFHTWQEFILKPHIRCIYCGKEGYVKEKQYKPISLTGFSALRKD